jgi:hypothetical protein
MDMDPLYHIYINQKKIFKEEWIDVVSPQSGERFGCSFTGSGAGGAFR